MTFLAFLRDSGRVLRCRLLLCPLTIVSDPPYHLVGCVRCGSARLYERVRP